MFLFWPSSFYTIFKKIVVQAVIGCKQRHSLHKKLLLQYIVFLVSIEFCGVTSAAIKFMKTGYHHLWMIWNLEHWSLFFISSDQFLCQGLLS